MTQLGTAVENPGPILGAGLRDVAEGSLTMPNMRGAVIGLFRPLEITVITTSIVKGLSQEVRKTYASAGTLQPMKARAVMLKPEGDRTLKWFVLHAGREIQLKPNDVVVRKGVPYRVMAVWPWEDYGFMKYELTEDYNAVKA